MAKQLDLDVEKMADYYRKGDSLVETAKKFGCSYDTVRRRFWNNGVLIREIGHYSNKTCAKEKYQILKEKSRDPAFRDALMNFIAERLEEINERSRKNANKD